VLHPTTLDLPSRRPSCALIKQRGAVRADRQTDVELPVVVILDGRRASGSERLW